MGGAGDGLDGDRRRERRRLALDYLKVRRDRLRRRIAGEAGHGRPCGVVEQIAQGHRMLGALLSGGQAPRPQAGVHRTTELELAAARQPLRQRAGHALADGRGLIQRVGVGRTCGRLAVDAGPGDLAVADDRHADAGDLIAAQALLDIEGLRRLACDVHPLPQPAGDTLGYIGLARVGGAATCRHPQQGSQA